jgi:cell division transport system ATP-binding protein
MITFENVVVRYDDGPPVLHDVNFELPAGSFHFLTGDSGVGKSTLLRIIYMALPPAGGRVTLFDRDVAGVKRAERPEFRRRIGVVFQEFRLIRHLTALENVALPLRLSGARETLIDEHVPELLDWVGLAGHHDAPPNTLSGGQQQRVAIARAVIGRPCILLADEPTGNVDDRIAMRLLYLFEELNKLGTTVLIATHNEALVDRFDHPRLHISDGTLTRVDPRAKPPARARAAAR